MFRILVCGGRDFNNPTLMIEHLMGYTDATIIEGCARGADRIAEALAPDLGYILEHHPADWNKYGRGAGFKRNVQMLDSGVDLVIAFWDGKSKGTQHTIDQAAKRGIETKVVMY